MSFVHRTTEYGPVAITPGLTCKMGLRGIAIGLLAIVVLTELSQLAQAEARVSVQAGTAGETLNDSGNGLVVASASVNGAKGGAAYGAFATVDGTIDSVTMRAHAYASAPPVINPETFLYRAGASARVSWSDEMLITNFDGSLVDFQHSGRIFVFRFNPHIHGTADGSTYSYQISASFSGSNSISFGHSSYRLTRTQVAGALAVNETLGSLPLQVVLNADTPEQVAEIGFIVSASLFIEAGSNPGDGTSSGPAEVDFRNTVSLGPIMVSDENGNYIPGSESLRIVGSSGVVYEVLAVPEPSTWVLAITGLTAWGALRRRSSSFH